MEFCHSEKVGTLNVRPTPKLKPEMVFVSANVNEPLQYAS